MTLSRSFLALLLLPGLALGSGLDLRICAHGVFGSQGCCTSEPDCCSEKPLEPRAPVAEGVDPCGACCFDIQTPVEQSLPIPEGLSKGLKRAQVVALVVSLEVPVPCALERAAPAPRLLSGEPPGRRIPLPLRI